MQQNNPTWLPHLTSEIVADARGPELDAFAVALEGWRRGLTLKWHTKDSEKFSKMSTWFVDRPGKLFSLRSTDRTHYFFRTRGDLVSNEAVDIGADKEKTKHWLSKAGVSTPEGKSFNADVGDEEIIQYAATIGYPVVLKPTDGSFGRGVMTNIQDEEDLGEALVYIRTEMNEPNVIVERYVPGEEYRLYVVGDQVVAAIHRIPANVVGDGVNTIHQLIDLKNKERETNPRLISCPIKIDDEMIDYIQGTSYTLESVLEDGEPIILTEKSNISLGGDPVDVLDELPDRIKETAVQALQAVPGLVHGAVDLILDTDNPVENKAVILELNPTAQIGSLLFPMLGQARDVPGAIIDYYFPETTEVVSDKSKIYYDFNDMLEPLITKSATVTTVSPAPLGTIHSKKYTVFGDVQGVQYHRGLRKQAFERNLSGFVTVLSDGSIEVIVAGINKEDVDQYRDTLLEDPERSEVQYINETEWEGSVKIGFEVKGDLKTQQEEYRKMKKEMEIIEIELRRAKQKQMKYRKSTSWILTAPFRKIADLFKYIFNTTT